MSKSERGHTHFAESLGGGEFGGFQVLGNNLSTKGWLCSCLYMGIIDLPIDTAGLQEKLCSSID